jgi:putative pyrroloquinoline-quinone binding quinoprotein
MSLSARVRRLIAICVVVAVGSLSCTSANSGREASTTRRYVTASGDDWTTYHYNQSRQGYDPKASPASGRLATAWTAHLDGAVYGEPLVVDDHVLVVTENDSMYSLDLSGGVVWRRHVGAPVPLSELGCGNIDPLGMTGTPIYSARTGLVYAVAELDNPIRHRLYAINALTGAVAWSRNLDQPGMVVATHQQRAALAIAHGRVWVTFGGLAGDCGEYHGWVIGNRLDGTGQPQVYRQPSDREGGIWAPSGPAVDSTGHLYVAVGNGAALAPPYDDSDSILKLDGATKIDLFAPSNWAEENRLDLDLGSTGPLLFNSFGRRFVFADGKEGTGYLLDQSHLGGIGGQLSTTSRCKSWGGTAYRGGVVYVPCLGGLTAYRVHSSPHLAPLWQNTAVQYGAAPVIGGGAVWAVYAGKLFQLDPSDGSTVTSIGLGKCPHFATPTLHGSLVLVGTLRGVTAVNTR